MNDLTPASSTSTNPATAPTQRLSPPAPAGQAAKPGYQTTEFWLSALAMVLGVVMASGAIPNGGTAAQIVGGVLSVLASLGYTASRTKVKSGGGE